MRGPLEACWVACPGSPVTETLVAASCMSSAMPAAPPKGRRVVPEHPAPIRVGCACGVGPAGDETSLLGAYFVYGCRIDKRGHGSDATDIAICYNVLV